MSPSNASVSLRPLAIALTLALLAGFATPDALAQKKKQPAFGVHHADDCRAATASHHALCRWLATLDGRPGKNGSSEVSAQRVCWSVPSHSVAGASSDPEDRSPLSRE